MKVGKVGGRRQSREHARGGLLFRIGHQRQIDQTLDRAPVEVLPEHLVFGLDPFPGGVRRNIDAEQSQAREPGGRRSRVFRFDGVQLIFSW